MSKLTDYSAFIYTTLMPIKWFDNMFPKTKGVNSGRKNTNLEYYVYAMPRSIAKVSALQRAAAKKSNSKVKLWF